MMVNTNLGRMNVSSLLVIAGLLLLAPDASAYDINCIYPENMPDPFTARFALVEAISAESIALGIETPIVVRYAELFGACGANCLAYHDTNALNVLTGQRPLLSVPSFGHNSFSRIMCIAQCYSIIAESSLLQQFWDEWGLEVQQVDERIINAENVGVILGIIIESDYHPFVIGQIVALEILNESVIDNKDGWNILGEKMYDPETGTIVNCTANCQYFSDTTGYIPHNHPHHPVPGEDKYNITGNDMYWQPLLESDGLGYFSRQEHVVPHVGFTAKPILRPLGEAAAPAYNYREEALQVVERLRNVANDPEKKKKIKFYDNKLVVRGVIQQGMKDQFPDTYSFEDELLLVYGLGVVEYDAVLNAWKEKVRHDLVRPTTVIQRWGSDELDTYNGDEKSNSSQIIMARDFQAFIRVMPHSEYPSGSGCICAGYHDFINAYTNGTGKADLVNMAVGPNGYSGGCDGKLPASFGCQEEEWFDIPDMPTLLSECGESRLWGGMHFTASVDAAIELCGGLGDLGFELVKKIRSGSTFTNTYYQGDPLPNRNAAGVECPVVAVEDEETVETVDEPNISLAEDKGTADEPDDILENDGSDDEGESSAAFSSAGEAWVQTFVVALWIAAYFVI